MLPLCNISKEKPLQRVIRGAGKPGNTKGHKLLILRLQSKLCLGCLSCPISVVSSGVHIPRECARQSARVWEEKIYWKKFGEKKVKILNSAYLIFMSSFKISIFVYFLKCTWYISTVVHVYDL